MDQCFVYGDFIKYPQTENKIDGAISLNRFGFITREHLNKLANVPEKPNLLQNLFDDFRLYKSLVQLDLNFMCEPQDDPMS